MSVFKHPCLRNVVIQINPPAAMKNTVTHMLIINAALTIIGVYIINHKIVNAIGTKTNTQHLKNRTGLMSKISVFMSFSLISLTAEQLIKNMYGADL